VALSEVRIRDFALHRLCSCRHGSLLPSNHVLVRLKFIPPRRSNIGRDAGYGACSINSFKVLLIDTWKVPRSSRLTPPFWPEAETALAFFALSHFRPENRIPRCIRYGAGFFLKMLQVSSDPMRASLRKSNFRSRQADTGRGVPCARVRAMIRR